MGKFLVSLIVKTLSVLITAYILPGIVLTSISAAFVTAVILGVLNTFIKPILNILALPITLLTLGLFSLVINTVLVLIVDKIVPGFAVSGFITAFLFSVAVSLINSFLSKLTD